MAARGAVDLDEIAVAKVGDPSGVERTIAQPSCWFVHIRMPAEGTGQGPSRLHSGHVCGQAEQIALRFWPRALISGSGSFRRTLIIEVASSRYSMKLASHAARRLHLILKKTEI
jgi:hypothetical protein